MQACAGSGSELSMLFGNGMYMFNKVHYHFTQMLCTSKYGGKKKKLIKVASEESFAPRKSGETGSEVMKEAKAYLPIHPGTKTLVMSWKV